MVIPGLLALVVGEWEATPYLQTTDWKSHLLVFLSLSLSLSFSLFLGNLQKVEGRVGILLGHALPHPQPLQRALHTFKPCRG